MNRKRFHRTLLVGSLALVAAILAPALGCTKGSRRESRRLVMITLDTLRYDSFAGTAERPSTMPHLKRWAAGAAVFERFYTATATTQPSHASMLTGLHPWQHGVSGNRQQLAAEHQTVAERLRDAGFATAAVVASVPVDRRSGFDQGFDHFDDDFVTGELREGGGLFVSREDTEAGEAGLEEAFYTLADTVTERALALVDAATARRQFFWFHYFDPHSPYGDTAGGETLRPQDVLRLAIAGGDATPALERARQLYDQDVAFLDAALGHLLARLEQDSAELETSVVVVADHGESFGEEGTLGHGRHLIASQIRVPCLIRSPRLVPGIRLDVAGSIDIAATLLALAGLPPDEVGGRDLTVPTPGARAYGMRRTYQKPHRDIRLDGSVHMLDDYLFYTVDEHGEICRGNRDHVIPPAPAAGLSAEKARALQHLFGRFEMELLQNRAASVENAEVKRALRALGYVE